MNTGSVTLITYLWHYLLARTIYDHLLRPLGHGDTSGLLLLGGVAAVAFAIGRWSGMRASRRASARRIYERRA
jgi:hypothetical protein